MSITYRAQEYFKERNITYNLRYFRCLSEENCTNNSLFNSTSFRLRRNWNIFQFFLNNKTENDVTEFINNNYLRHF